MTEQSRKQKRNALQLRRFERVPPDGTLIQLALSEWTAQPAKWRDHLHCGLLANFYEASIQVEYTGYFAQRNHGSRGERAGGGAGALARYPVGQPIFKKNLDVLEVAQN